MRYENKGVLVADEPGLGKTVQAIAVVNATPGIRAALIVCPPSLTLNWHRECGRWLTRNLPVRVIGADWPPNTDGINIVGDSRVAKHWQRLREREWDLVVIDEVHRLKDPKAQRSRAVFGNTDRREYLAPVVAERRLALTGTPIPNRPIEAQAFLGWLRPDLFGNRFSFAKRYAGAHKTRFGWDMTGASNLEQLQTQLRGNLMVRRLKRDVLKELPPKTRQIIEIEPNGAGAAVQEEQRAFEAHQEALDALRETVEVARLLEDQEAYKSAVAALKEGMGVAFAEMSEVRKQVALAKIPYVVEHVITSVENGPVVVFAHHRDVVSELSGQLAAEGIESVRVVGGMSAEAKQESVDRFQLGEVKVFIGNIQAAGVGLTLTRSNHVIFAELDWVPANMSQAEDRCHRIGSEGENVLIQHLVLAGSLDAHMAQMLVDKQAIADKALDIAIAREPVKARRVEHVEIEETTERIYTEEEISKMQDAMQRLAAVCDGEKDLDGQGFNKVDAHFGRTLAWLGKWTQRQAGVAHKLCIKYKRQVGEVI